MADATAASSKPTAGTGVGVYFLAGPMVVALAGIGGHFGERIGGGPGYWAGCYLAGAGAAAVAGWLFARLFRGHPLVWALGAVGMLVGGHLTWVATGGRTAAAPAGGSDQLLIGAASLIGLAAGLVAAQAVLGRRAAGVTPAG